MANTETIYDSMQVMIGAGGGIVGQCPIEIGAKWNSLWKPLHPQGDTNELQCMVLKDNEGGYHFTAQRYFNVSEIYPYLDEVTEKVEREYPDTKTAYSPELLGNKTGILVDMPVTEAEAQNGTVSDKIDTLVEAVKYMESYIAERLPKYTVSFEQTPDDGFVLSDGKSAVKLTAHDAQRFFETYLKDVRLREVIENEITKLIYERELPEEAAFAEGYKEALLDVFYHSVAAGTEEGEALEIAFDSVKYQEKETLYYAASYANEDFRSFSIGDILVEGWDAAAKWAHNELINGNSVEIFEKGRISGLKIKSSDYIQKFREQDITEFPYKPEDVNPSKKPKTIEER